MRKSRKLLCLLMTVIMIFSSFTMAFAFDSSYTIKADETISVEVIENDYIYVKFIPEKTATYEFSSGSDEDDPYAAIYDEAEKLIAEGDDSDGSYNFCIEAALIAGKTYYIEIGNYSDRTATISISVTTVHIHENLTEYPALAATCTQDGRTYGLQCDDCGFWLVESETIYASHTDADADRICDICTESAIIASETTASGVSAVFYTCGDLVISGAGEFEFFDFDSNIYYKRNDVKKIFVGKDITLLPTLFGPSAFEGFIVDADNSVYKSDAANVLYSKDGTKILNFPTVSTLEEYTVPDGVTEIAESVFAHNKTLRKVNFPNSLKVIDDYAFFCCTALEEVILPVGIEKIGSCAFDECNNITQLNIPESVTYIGDYAFVYSNIENTENVDGCIYIDNILVDFDPDTFNGNVLDIREGTRLIAVSGSYLLSVDTIIIPASLKYSESTFFSYYTKKFIVNENSPYYSTDENGILFNKDKTIIVRYPKNKEITDYTVPQGVKEIAPNAFSYSNITSVTFSEGLEKIGFSAFEGCNIYNLKFPSTLKEIDSFAFDNAKMKAVVIPASVEKIGTHVFNCDYIVIMNPDCMIEDLPYNSLIVGYDGSTAEKYCSEKEMAFATLGSVNGENHHHIYFPTIITPEGCETNGLYEYSCPCGNAQTYTATIEATGHYWWPFGDGMRCNQCYMEIPFNEYYGCDCECHEERSEFKDFFFRIKLFFWKLFRIKEYCDCGNKHW